MIARSRSEENCGTSVTKLSGKATRWHSLPFLSSVRWSIVIFTAKSRKPRSVAGVGPYISKIAWGKVSECKHCFNSLSTFSFEIVFKPSINIRPASEYIEIWNDNGLKEASKTLAGLLGLLDLFWPISFSGCWEEWHSSAVVLTFSANYFSWRMSWSNTGW